MLEAIKLDLKLSDQQVALIFGLVGQFTLAFASLLISPLADKYSRRLIIGIGLLILGFCNIGSALVATAGLLLMVRFIGGVGGAGNGPATFSLLADLFPPPKLPKAMATMKDGSKPDYISSDCPLGGHHIAQGFEVNGHGAPELQHPLSLVARAYGLK